MAVTNPKEASNIGELRVRARNLYQILQKWLSDHYGPNAKPSVGMPEWYEAALGQFYCFFIIASRMLTAITWEVDPLVEKLEAQTQRHANALLKLKKEHAARYGAEMLLASKGRIAQAALETHADWRKDGLEDSLQDDKAAMIPPWKFEAWCNRSLFRIP